GVFKLRRAKTLNTYAWTEEYPCAPPSGGFFPENPRTPEARLFQRIDGAGGGSGEFARAAGISPRFCRAYRGDAECGMGRGGGDCGKPRGNLHAESRVPGKRKRTRMAGARPAAEAPGTGSVATEAHRPAHCVLSDLCERWGADGDALPGAKSGGFFAGGGKTVGGAGEPCGAFDGEGAAVFATRAVQEAVGRR